jgi:hypothetical protein
MKIIVLGKRLSGKTPFCIEVSEALGWQHIEALNWLRKHFESGEFAMMLHDPVWMDHIVHAELASNPNACSEYVRHKLRAGRTALVDGLFTLPDFLSIFDPTTDHIVQIEHIGNRVTPTVYESHLAEIEMHLKRLAVNHKIPQRRLHVYKFNDHRRSKERDSVDRKSDGYHCSSLEAAIAHFIKHNDIADAS